MINKYLLTNLFLIILLIILSILFIEKKPLYNDKKLSELINYLGENTESTSLIQTNFEVYERYNYTWISPLIRSISKRSIFFDNSFTFNLDDSNEWYRRKLIINEAKKLINLSSPKLGLCKLKSEKINYYISTMKIESVLAKKVMDFNNSYFYIYNLNKINLEVCNN